MRDNSRGPFVVGVAILLLACCRDAPPAFELRDFVVRKTSGEFGTSYDGRGTFVVRGGAGAEDTLLVVLQYREKGNAQDKNWRDCVVFVSGGVGTVDTSKRLSSDEAMRLAAPEYEWRIRGYSQLRPAALTVK